MSVDVSELAQRLGLSEPAQRIISLVARKSGSYTREQLIGKIQTTLGLELGAASEAYKEARATGIILPQIIGETEGSESGRILLHPMYEPISWWQNL